MIFKVSYSSRFPMGSLTQITMENLDFSPSGLCAVLVLAFVVAVFTYHNMFACVCSDFWGGIHQGRADCTLGEAGKGGSPHAMRSGYLKGLVVAQGSIRRHWCGLCCEGLGSPPKQQEQVKFRNSRRQAARGMSVRRNGVPDTEQGDMSTVSPCCAWDDSAGG